MKTRKIYYEDAYQSEFSSEVINCEKVNDGYEIELKQTCFYPEGGGQPSDTGYLNQVQVYDVYEVDGIIKHCVKTPIEIDTTVIGKIDMNRRFSLMQRHTGEHIISGLIKNRFGFDNVGFHMGNDYATMDISGILSDKDISEIEIEANRAVYANVAVISFFPSNEEIEHLEYRSKKELTGQIRIVKIDEYDICACSGLHCKSTVEIGLVKIIQTQKYKKGMRFTLLCGEEALKDYMHKQEIIKAIGSKFSAKQTDILETLERLHNDYKNTKWLLSKAREDHIFMKSSMVKSDANLLAVFEEGLSMEETKMFCMNLSGRFTAVAVFSKKIDSEYYYSITSEPTMLKEITIALNSLFNVKGGGKGNIVLGTLNGSLNDIKKFLFNNRFEVL